MAKSLTGPAPDDKRPFSPTSRCGDGKRCVHPPPCMRRLAELCRRRFSALAHSAPSLPTLSILSGRIGIPARERVLVTRVFTNSWHFQTFKPCQAGCEMFHRFKWHFPYYEKPRLFLCVYCFFFEFFILIIFPFFSFEVESKKSFSLS